MSSFLETPEIAAARAAAEAADAEWFRAKEGVEAAEAAADDAKAEAAGIARKVGTAERELASGTPTVRAAWTKARGEAEIADARARACHQAAVDALKALHAAEQAQNGAWTRHAELVRVAKADECTRILVERDALLLAAQSKWSEAEAFFNKHLRVERTRLFYEPLVATDAIEIFDRAGRSATFHPPPPPRFREATAEEIKEARARRDRENHWGVLSEDEAVQLAHLVMTHGGRAVAGVLGLRRFNTSDAGWYELARIPRHAWPKYVSPHGRKEPDGEDIAEVQRALRGVGVPNEEQLRKLLGLPARRTAAEG